MDIIRIALLSTIALGGMSAAASAADLVVDAPAAPVVASDWTGAYIGAQAGVLSLTTSEDYDPSYTTPYDPYWEMGAVGASVGVFAGYDYQVSDLFVLGLSGEVNLDNALIKYDGYDYLSLEWDAAVKVRGGMLVNPSTLVYATLGYSVASFSLNDGYWSGYDLNSNPVGGWVIGAGVESEVADGLFLRGEATATFYDDLGVSDTSDPYWVITPTVVKATAGLVYKF